jgi:hypothetical protein
MSTMRIFLLLAALGMSTAAAWSQPVQPVTLQDLILAPGVATQPAPAITSVGASGGASGGPATAPATRPALTSAQEQAAGDLMKQLGDDDYTTRENATKKLIALGEAIQPLAKAKLQEKNLDPEIVHRLGLVIKATTPMQEGTEVTDEATGITVSIQPGGQIVQASRGGQVIWTSGYGLTTSLRLKDGQLTILPRGFLIELTTGRMLGRVPIKG